MCLRLVSLPTRFLSPALTPGLRSLLPSLPPLGWENTLLDCGSTAMIALVGCGPSVVTTLLLGSVTSCIRDVLVDMLLVALHSGLLATAQMALWNTRGCRLADPARRRGRRLADPASSRGRRLADPTSRRKEDGDEGDGEGRRKRTERRMRGTRGGGGKDGGGGRRGPR